MHAVVNRLPIKPDIDWAALARKVDEFNALIDHSDFRGASLVRIGDDAALVLVLFAGRPALDKLSREVAAPWFADNIRPYVAGPGERLVGEIVAGALAT
jgi:hypothetical protein